MFLFPQAKTNKKRSKPKRIHKIKIYDDWDNNVDDDWGNNRNDN